MRLIGLSLPTKTSSQDWIYFLVLENKSKYMEQQLLYIEYQTV
jgi:hypothetical protein